MRKTKTHPLITTAPATKGTAAYDHVFQRRTTPEPSLVTPDNDPEVGKTQCTYDPHLAPGLRFDAQSTRRQVEPLLVEVEHGNDSRIEWLKVINLE